jgi:hypothetical protein
MRSQDGAPRIPAILVPSAVVLFISFLLYRLSPEALAIFLAWLLISVPAGMLVGHCVLNKD